MSVLGAYAGQNMTTSSQNTVLIGVEAGANNGSRDSIFIGEAAGKDSTANDQVMIGQSAGSNSSSGVENVFIGSGSGTQNGAGAYNVCVGKDTVTGTSTYNVAIGHTAGSFTGHSGAHSINIGYQTGQYYMAGGKCMAIGSACRPQSNLSHIYLIGHDFQGANTTKSISIGDNTSYIHCTWGSSSSWSRTSDERVKKDFSASKLGLDFINDLEPVSYKFRPVSEIDESLRFENQEDRMDLDVYHLGLKAQNVRSALANYTENGYNIVDEDTASGRLSMSYEQLITPLIQAVKDLSAKVNQLESEIETLRS